MAKQVRLGIIGLPAQGSMYARLITDGIVPNMDIGAICEPNPAMAEVTGSTYPGVGFHVDSLTMLDSGDVDAVVICVPSLPASGDGYRRAAAASTPWSRSRPAYTRNRCESLTNMPRRSPSCRSQ